ncbi:MerR family transcriptional regulator [Faecalibaculum rodentium]|uniref:MerR family transcriptional regulator n=1 Tax=Faecalibaculum rodentium TaxID=1702221 RepID=UPI0023F452D0|nr:MerR family transcriptional regulator [Faecalibaculum rodentium]
MLINEACRKSGLTKKAIEYYETQGLIHPVIRENSYREFAEDDIRRLKRIAVLRRLGLSVPDIRQVLTDNNTAVLQAISTRKALELEYAQDKQQLLKELVETRDWEDIRTRLEQLDRKQSIRQRLLDRFPGPWGQYLSFHFAPYLSEPVGTVQQQEAFETIIDYLDRIEISLPEDLMTILDEAARSKEPSVTDQVQKNMAAALQDPGQYLDANREMLERYLAFRNSREYRNSPAGKLQRWMEQFSKESGYQEIFIPAMKRLSPSYRAYHEKLTCADRRFQSSLKMTDTPD